MPKNIPRTNKQTLQIICHEKYVVFIFNEPVHVVSKGVIPLFVRPYFTIGTMCKVYKKCVTPIFAKKRRNK